MTRLNDNLQHIFLSPWLLIKKKGWSRLTEKQYNSGMWIKFNATTIPIKKRYHAVLRYDAVCCTLKVSGNIQTLFRLKYDPALWTFQCFTELFKLRNLLLRFLKNWPLFKSNCFKWYKTGQRIRRSTKRY